MNEIKDAGGGEVPVSDLLEVLGLPEEVLERMNEKRGPVDFEFHDGSNKGSFCNAGKKVTEKIPGSPLKLRLKKELKGDITVTEDGVALENLEGIAGMFGPIPTGIDSLTVKSGSVDVGL